MRPDIDALVSSGLFDQMLAVLGAFERGGVEGLQTTDIGGLYTVLSILRKAMSHPACNAQIRGAGSSLAFAMEHSLDMCEELGYTTGSYAASLCENSHHSFALARCSWFCADSLLYRCLCLAGCAVFGRDEGASDFTFTQQQVDALCALSPTVVCFDRLCVTVRLL